MEKLDLTLRQRKLLHRMQQQSGFVTGSTLALELGVTPRTIRSDVTEINRVLSRWDAAIRSERSKGYRFLAADPEQIRRLNQIELALLTREDRERYLAFRLCLAEEPLNFFDLEDEMYVSHTTLEQDLQSVRRRYCEEEPHLELLWRRGEVSFRREEEKLRALLTRLTHEDWDYSQKGNAYYSYHFLDEQIMDWMLREMPELLRRHGLLMEDPVLVYLATSAAVTVQRFREGHPLPPVPEGPLSPACEDLFRRMEEAFGCTFPYCEKHAIDALLLQAHPADRDPTDPAFFFVYVSNETRQIADRYLDRIHALLGIDFRGDRDFYITLCYYLRDLQRNLRIYSNQEHVGLTKDRLLDEMELAMLFQDIARESFGRLLSEIELINLAHCIAGALEFLFRMHPEYQLRTVICGHRDMASLWSAKRDVLGAFSNYVNITHLMPLNAAAHFDFSGTDLVLVTVQRDLPGAPTALPIHYILTEEDRTRISAFISQKMIERLWPAAGDSDILRRAVWHEKAGYKTRGEAVEALLRDFSDDPGLLDRLRADLRQREEITSFVTGPGIVFLHSLQPAAESRLSVMTMDHRIIWNGCKIRILLLGVFPPEEIPMLLRLKHRFFSRPREEVRMLKTRQEVGEAFGFSTEPSNE